MVQGEAPPSVLFTRFKKKVIARSRASHADISFYLAHWFTDLAGAAVYEGRLWPGGEKFTTQFPVRVLAGFVESFDFVDRLASKSEVGVIEDYLNSRWEAGSVPPLDATNSGAMSLQRLTHMRKGLKCKSWTFQQATELAWRRNLLGPHTKSSLNGRLLQ